MSDPVTTTIEIKVLTKTYLSLLQSSEMLGISVGEVVDRLTLNAV